MKFVRNYLLVFVLLVATCADCTPKEKSTYKKWLKSAQSTVRKFYIDKVIQRGWPYVLLGLFLLRQVPDAKVKKWDNTILNKLKLWVGSSREMARTVQMTIGYAYSKPIEEQKNEIDSYNSKNPKNHVVPVAVNIPRESTWFSKYLFGFDDGRAFVLPIAWLITKHVKKDIDDLFKSIFGYKLFEEEKKKK